MANNRDGVNGIMSSRYVNTWDKGVWLIIEMVSMELWVVVVDKWTIIRTHEIRGVANLQHRSVKEQIDNQILQQKNGIYN